LCAGVIISHSGSGGLEGAVDAGDNSISVELSQPLPIRGEYAGVDGAESMKVPKDLAVNGGDCMLGDMGVIGGDVGGEKGDMMDENR
jgi:hypothetical protein